MSDIQGKEGVRPTAGLDATLGQELADRLWAVLTVADCCSVDLESAFDSTMTELNSRLDRAVTDGLTVEHAERPGKAPYGLGLIR